MAFDEGSVGLRRWKRLESQASTWIINEFLLLNTTPKYLLNTRNFSSVKQHITDIQNVSINKTVSIFQDDDEDLGDVYQDELNQAAMLLYRDREDQALLMVRIIRK